MDAEDRVLAILDELADLTDAFPDHPVTANTLEVYARSLLDLHPELVGRAVARCLGTCDRFPRIAQIRAAAFLEGEDGVTPEPGEAWGEVERSFGTVGRDRVPAFSHPMIAETVRLMGWARLCLSEQTDVIRGQFMTAYREIRARRREEAVTRPLVRGKQHALAAGVAGALTDGKKKR